MGLIVNELTKKFGEKTAVDHLSFSMEGPGVFGLLGTNGAGKTTTIRTILGIMSPDSGSATWNNTPITRETSMEGPGVFGLLGTNGAGKTTTIRTILGIMSPDSGSATWNNTPITRETLAFGYLPEERGIYMKTKVLEQLIYFGMLRGMKKEAALAICQRRGGFI